MIDSARLSNVLWQPTAWIGAVLGFVLPPLGLLYVGRAVAAAVYLLLTVIAIIVDSWVVRHYSAQPWSHAISLLLALMLASSIHAYSIARNNHPSMHRPWFTKPVALITLPAAFIIAFFSFCAFLFETYRLSTSSMAPTLVPGDRLLVEKWPFGNYTLMGTTLLRSAPETTATPQRFDTMIFQDPDKPSHVFVKRVIGLPGDHLSYKGKKLTINDQPVEQRLLRQTPTNDIYEERYEGVSYTIELTRSDDDPTSFDVEVPESHYFMMGDNRDMSNDSRHWGPLSREHFIGRVIFVW